MDDAEQQRTSALIHQAIGCLFEVVLDRPGGEPMSAIQRMFWTQVPTHLHRRMEGTERNGKPANGRRPSVGRG